MARSSVRFHPHASKEYEAALVWYFRISQKLGIAFEGEVDRAIRLIKSNPDRWPSFGKLHRRILIRRFPYLLVYSHSGSTVWVVAVMHGKRKPGYWSRRRVPVKP
ncbi:MAG: type II toxin-antitoxin system RelE/ParE family toxin [Nitrospirae bacterium]|nr:type II toxin-antitoxin system RelE/ParE family toxin [Nitrospirota bacterium]